MKTSTTTVAVATVAPAPVAETRESLIARLSALRASEKKAREEKKALREALKSTGGSAAVTRIDSAFTTLAREGEGAPFSILVAKTDADYVISGGKKNTEQSVYATGVALGALEALGLIVVTGKGEARSFVRAGKVVPFALKLPY